MVMPGMNGQSLAGRLIQQYPDLKVLYISGYTANYRHNGSVSAAIAENGFVFLEKPFTPDMLTRKVREVLRENHPI